MTAEPRNDSPESVYAGAMPTHEGAVNIELRGMAPIPLSNRYGRLHRQFTIWFTPNLVPAGFFIGSLGTASFVGVGFGLGVVAIVVGTLLGGLLVAALGTWGPHTGVGQIPLARLPFGRSVVLPGILQWLSTIAWDALNAIFGAEAIHLLIHVPFWIGLLIVLVLQGVLGLFGYEWMHTFEKWMSIVLGIMFVIITIKIAAVGNFHAAATAHGADLVGGFILMVTLAASFAIPWGVYASDYSRYLKPSTSRAGIFWLSLAGVAISSIWVEILGLAASSLVPEATSAGISKLLGGGALGGMAMVAIWIGTVAVNAVNDYSGSLALQATGARIKRPYIAVIVTVLAFFLTLYLNTGDLATKFENVLLFITYWIPPFAAVQIVHWMRHRGRLDLTHLLDIRELGYGWDALVAMVVGFAAAIPFMDTSLYVGPAASSWLHGGDIAFYVGFVVGGVLYWLLQIGRPVGVLAAEPARALSPMAGVVLAADGSTPDLAALGSADRPVVGSVGQPTDSAAHVGDGQADGADESRHTAPTSGEPRGPSSAKGEPAGTTSHRHEHRAQR
jgi:NCS1 family nucleobase:cation symporter-1